MENHKTKRFFSIKVKITFQIVSFVLMLMCMVFLVSYINTKGITRSDLRTRLLNEVNIAVLQVDVEKHNLLRTKADEETEAYGEIKKTLQKIRNNSTDIYYIYTMRENENKDISFVVDAEENPENVSHIGDVYDNPNKFLKDNFLTINKPTVENDFTSDKWGTWISAYAPFYNKNGNREGVLGIDVKASSVIASENRIFFIYFLAFVLSGLLSIILGIFLSKKIINSINSLTKILKGDTNSEKMDTANIGNDEIGELADAFREKMNKEDLSKKESEERIANKTKTLEKINELMVGRELEMIRLKKEINELKNKIDSSAH